MIKNKFMGNFLYRALESLLGIASTAIMFIILSLIYIYLHWSFWLSLIIGCIFSGAIFIFLDLKLKKIFNQ